MVSSRIIRLLDHAGYTFHEENGVHWFVWGFPNGTCDYETGGDCASIDDAREAAVAHFLINARILTTEQEDTLASAGWLL